MNLIVIYMVVDSKSYKFVISFLMNIKLDILANHDSNSTKPQRTDTHTLILLIQVHLFIVFGYFTRFNAEQSSIPPFFLSNLHPEMFAISIASD